MREASVKSEDDSKFTDGDEVEVQTQVSYLGQGKRIVPWSGPTALCVPHNFLIISRLVVHVWQRRDEMLSAQPLVQVRSTILPGE